MRTSLKQKTITHINTIVLVIKNVDHFVIDRPQAIVVVSIVIVILVGKTFDDELSVRSDAVTSSIIIIVIV